MILFSLLGINSVFLGVSQAENKSNEGSFNWLGGFTVPLIVAIIAAIAASWTFIQARWNGHYFQKLLLKELAEFKPNLSPKTLDPTQGFDQLMKRDFIHKEILDKPTENKDYIFSINLNLLYLTKQLWSAFKDSDIERFLKFFCRLTKAKSSVLGRDFDRNWRISDACKEWVDKVKKDNIPEVEGKYIRSSEVFSQKCKDECKDKCEVNLKNIKDEFIKLNKSQNSKKP